MNILPSVTYKNGIRVTLILVMTYDRLTTCISRLYLDHDLPGWAKLNGADAVSFVLVKHVSDNLENFWQVK